MATDEFRPDIEGLRALAVVVVVLFHAKVAGFEGGFVGVDVFFVLSGFLITRLLIGELARTGTISLPSFWARRARRLLPASVFVVAVTIVASRWMLNPLAQRAVATDAIASGGFVVNFVFAHRLGDYFGAQLGDLEPSPLLHFWSLAVEEQFYLLWPLTLFVATRRPRQYRRLILTIMLGVAAASLVASIWLTDIRPTWAFYLLPARMGELLAGAAVVAVGPGFAAVDARFRSALGWFGIVGIGVAVMTYDSATVFPGSATLLPVLSTVLVLTAGGAGAAASGPILALRHPVAQWIGHRSYTIYLWHWPALVLFDARYGPLSMSQRLAVVALSIGLAAGTTMYIESPIRHLRWLAVRPGRGLALGGALCAAALAIGWTARVNAPALDSGQVAAAPVLAVGIVPTPSSTIAPESGAVATPDASTAPSTSAAALTELTGGDLADLVSANRRVLEQGIDVTDVPSNLRPTLAGAGGDRAAIYADGCVNIGVDAAVHVTDESCRYGSTDAPVRVVLFGDSHAAQWFPALRGIVEDRGDELIVLTKGGCPTAAVSIPTATLARTCPQWRDAAIEFVANEHPDVVIVSGWAGYPNSDDEWRTGFDDTLSRLAPLTSRLIVLGDNPPTTDQPASCLSNHLRSADACVSDRAHVVATSRLDIERTVAGRYGADFVDPTDWLCTDTECPVIIGDVLLYRDVTHLTTIATLWFEPLLAAGLRW